MDRRDCDSDQDGNKLAVGESSWVASVKKTKDEQDKSEKVLRALKEILNDLTIENFDQLYQRVADVMQRYHLSNTLISPDTLTYVSSLTISDLEEFINSNVATPVAAWKSEIARAPHDALEQTHQQDNNDIPSPLLLFRTDLGLCLS